MLLLKTVNLSVDFITCGRKEMIYTGIDCWLHHALQTLIYLNNENNNQNGFGSFFHISRKFHHQPMPKGLPNESNSISLFFDWNSTNVCVWFTDAEIFVHLVLIFFIQTIMHPWVDRLPRPCIASASDKRKKYPCPRWNKMKKKKKNMKNRNDKNKRKTKCICLCHLRKSGTKLALN